MPIGAAAPFLPIAGSLIGGAIGGGGPSNAQPVLPKDLQPLRQQNIGLLQYLLGFNQPGMPWSQPQPQAPQPGGGGSFAPGSPMPGQPGGFVGPSGGMVPWNVTGPTTMFGQVPAAQGGPIQRPSTFPTSTTPQTGGGTPGMFGGTSAVPFTGPMANSVMPTGGGTPANTGGITSQIGTMLGQMGATPQTGGGTPGAPGFPNPLGRIESFFGPLGTPTTPLQQQSLGGISQFLNSNPYGQSNNALQQITGGGMFEEANQGFRQAGQGNFFGDAGGIFQNLANFNPFGAATGAMEGQLGTNPGQAVMEALRPQFERNLAAAKQTGGRFGSANAIMQSRAMDDYNLLGAQALQRGVDQQQNAANILGTLGNYLGGFQQAAGQGMLGVGQGRLGQALGSAQGLAGTAGDQMRGLLGASNQLANNATSGFNALQGAYQTGSAQAQQEAQRQQQALQILQNLLGASFGATLGVPSAVGPTGAQTGAQLGGAVGSLLPFLGGGQQGGGMVPPTGFSGSNWASFGMPYGF